MKRIICLILSISMLLISATSVLAASKAGEGVGVSSTAPTSTIITNGVTPPSTSNETITLGEYSGTITWATGLMYTDKWVRYNGNTIDIYATFGEYGSKADAINRTNPLSQKHAPIKITLVDKAGNRTTSDYIYCNSGEQHIYFTVTPNKDYYVEFDFRTGDYQSGDFKIR